MATFTSSLPDHLLEQLSQAAKDLQLPKNKIIEKALEIYLEQLDRAAFLKSYKKMANDPDMLAMAEEGMADYFKQLEDLDKE
ncbi:ribbon-helix-helix domain-containing protein [Aequorivita viscosa]|uniref:Ribbon-helix-helix domain-containing protein n=1 Tax=Aequorivita viscosa TaxID=797419 RepID=A0A1M6LS54_9FLAO|nr:ribbon-helix-helix domain-containing protein [Aequorivita viscosa]SDX26141.1 Ribbon-helix-helix domain-containing protein [Aequorivita viscosa]SHJ74009.1 Ribbon-helix-helix domain-containing protein [Aequorivita viscosa]